MTEPNGTDMKPRKQIVIDMTTAERLEKYMGYKDSYNKIIVMLLDEHEKVGK